MMWERYEARTGRAEYTRASLMIPLLEREVSARERDSRRTRCKEGRCWEEAISVRARVSDFFLDNDEDAKNHPRS